MTALPLSILALAAGVYLLIKVKKEYLNSLFSVLAWFVIMASLVSLGFSSVRCIHSCCRVWCHDNSECRMEKQIIIKDGEGGGCHHMNEGGCSMEGCKMEGDSCVMDKAMCEKMMGKEACDSICKERGRCIMSKDECMKMCHPKGGCMGDKKESSCPMHKEDGMMMGGKSGCSMHKEGGMMEGKSGCCMDKGGEPKKACCKKKAE